MQLRSLGSLTLGFGLVRDFVMSIYYFIMYAAIAVLTAAVSSSPKNAVGTLPSSLLFLILNGWPVSISQMRIHTKTPQSLLLLHG